ncbi:hypothetical protein MCEMIEM12_02029 [Burkholderiaceae bacterium]
MQKVLLTISIIFVSACGGGGGEDSSPPSSSVACITSQVANCTFSQSDPTQFMYGWWNGRRSVNGNQSEAYFASNRLGNFQMYIGNDFAGGYFSGSGSASGSILSLNSTVGVDPLASSLYSAYLNGANGGVITKKILNHTQANYNLAKHDMRMSFTYNPVGDEMLSKYVGSYVSGAKSLTINPNGSVVAIYQSYYVTDNPPTYLCTLTTNIPTNTLMKDVVLNGIDSCNQNRTMSLFYFTHAGFGHMVLRLDVANSTAQKAIVF